MTSTSPLAPIELTPDHEQFRREIHRFAAEVVRPAAMEIDKIPDPADAIAPSSPMWPVMQQAIDLGYHKIGFPEEMGGITLDPIQQFLFAEEMAWGSVGLAFTIGGMGFAFQWILNTGNDDLINRYVVPFMEMKEPKFQCCWAITEPQHGSDTITFTMPHFTDPKAAGDLRASRDGDEWVINGQKSAWVSGGTIATHGLVFLTVDPSMGMQGGGVAFVPFDLPGVTKAPPTNKLGQRELNQGEIFFDNVRIPADHMLSTPDNYLESVETILTMANAGMGTAFTGVARAAYDEAFAYARQREQGGAPLVRHQLIQKKLFDMWLRVQTAEQLSRSVALRNASGNGGIQYSVASKVYCTQASFENASDAVQIFGGYGMVKDFFVEKLFRDARASLIEDGTNEVLSLSAFARLLALSS